MIAEKGRRWLITQSVGLGVTQGILWAGFGLLWVLPDLAARSGPLHWIAALLGFFLSVSYFQSAWRLRCQAPEAGRDRPSSGRESP